MSSPGKVPKLLTSEQQSDGLVYESFPTFAREGELGFFTFKDFENHLAHDGVVPGRDVVSCPATILVERHVQWPVQWPGQIFFDPTRGRADRASGQGRHLKGRRDGGPLDRRLSESSRIALIALLFPSKARGRRAARRIVPY
jgi:hypothetical protein